jgi:hypothetical protein
MDPTQNTLSESLINLARTAKSSTNNIYLFISLLAIFLVNISASVTINVRHWAVQSDDDNQSGNLKINDENKVPISIQIGINTVGFLVWLCVFALLNDNSRKYSMFHNIDFWLFAVVFVVFVTCFVSSTNKESQLILLLKGSGLIGVTLNWLLVKYLINDQHVQLPLNECYSNFMLICVMTTLLVVLSVFSESIFFQIDVVIFSVLLMASILEGILLVKMFEISLRTFLLSRVWANHPSSHLDDNKSTSDSQNIC